MQYLKIPLLSPFVMFNEGVGALSLSRPHSADPHGSSSVNKRGLWKNHRPHYNRLNYFAQLLLLNVFSDIERNSYEDNDTDGNVLRVCIYSEELESNLQKLKYGNTDDSG